MPPFKQTNRVAIPKLGQTFLLFLLFTILVLIVPMIGEGIINQRLGMDISGWMQAIIALISFPVILSELHAIRQETSRKPELEVGLANIKDLPFSQIRKKEDLPASVNVSTGYAHFYIVLRNIGTGPARYIKVYVEHTNREENQNLTIPPLVKVSEFSENKSSFVHEHNFDFVFRAGTEWIINPEDIEPFGFHISSSIYRRITTSDDETQSIPEFPSPCTISLNCTIWAEGLDQPLERQLIVNVVENL